MALDDETAARYRPEDSATLLALLPELRVQTARAKVHLEAVQRATEANGEFDVGLHEMQNEALAAFSTRLDPDDEVGRERLDVLRAEFAKQRDQLPDGSNNENEYVRVFSYLVELAQRERWIGDELVRRGLIPEWPSES